MSRFEWSMEPNDLSLLLEEKRRQGATILDLTESNPTRAELNYPAEIAQALADPRALRYEPTPWGLDSARQAVAALHGVETSRVMLTASTSESYSYLFKLLCDPGDNVLIPAPSYPLFEFLAKLESVEIRSYPLRFAEGRWSLDLGAIARAIDSGTRAICVVNPNNPTGSYLRKDETERLAELALRHGLALISDEVFSCYPVGEDPERVTTLAGVEGPPTFCLNGLSKMAGLPQMKAGWMVMSAAQPLREKLELIADTFLSVSTPVQYALPALLAHGETVRRQISERTRANLEWLQARACPLPVEGGWYATLPIGEKAEEDFVLSMLREHNVLLQPGFFYDFATDGFIVLSLLTPFADFQRGVELVIRDAPAASRPSFRA